MAVLTLSSEHANIAEALRFLDRDDKANSVIPHIARIQESSMANFFQS